MLAIADADHAETAPDAQHLVVSKLVCSLVGATEQVDLVPGTLASQAYGSWVVREQFACSFGLNPIYLDQIFRGDCKAAGFGPAGEVRVLELTSRRFFVATLFLPQMSSTPGHPHPLILAFLQAAAQV